MGFLKAVVNPLLLKLGIALTVSSVGFLYVHFRFIDHAEQPPPRSGASHSGSSSAELEDETQDSISIETMVSEQVETDDKEETLSESSPKGSMDENNLLLPEYNTELVLEEFIVSGDPKMKHGNFEINDFKKSKKDSIESQPEMEELKDQVRVLQERERNLQMKLLEYYGLKEQENVIKELESRLKIMSMESKNFELKAQSLQDENQRLRDEVSNHSNVALELESARKTVVFLRKQMKTEGELAKSQLSSLKEDVSTFLTLERKSLEEDEEVKKKLQRLHDSESETTTLRNMNERLQNENMKLVMKLDSANTAACNSYSDEYSESNKKLMEEIERLRTDRCADAEELVYLKWVNACLRYELRNLMAEPDKSTACNLSKTLSPKSVEKAKKLIFEYACSGSDSKSSLPDLDSDYYSPSSTITDTGEFDDSPAKAPSAKSNNSSKNNLFHKMRRLILGKHNPTTGRNYGSWSDWDRRCVSKRQSDEMLGPYSRGSFSSTTTTDCISPAVLSDARSKSLRVDPMEIERITKKSTELADPRAVSRTVSDIPRGSRLRIRSLGEDVSAKQLDFVNTNSEGEITDEDIQREREKIRARQISSEKVELVKSAEVLHSSCRHSMVHNKQGFGSF